jgi:hypothetical protein
MTTSTYLDLSEQVLITALQVQPQKKTIGIWTEKEIAISMIHTKLTAHAMLDAKLSKTMLLMVTGALRMTNAVLVAK